MNLEYFACTHAHSPVIYYTHTVHISTYAIHDPLSLMNSSEMLTLLVQEHDRITKGPPEPTPNADIKCMRKLVHRLSHLRPTTSTNSLCFSVCEHLCFFFITCNVVIKLWLHCTLKTRNTSKNIQDKRPKNLSQLPGSNRTGSPSPRNQVSCLFNQE